ncbi:MAG: 4-(cytidine 5'-diphospho)-2-C-methyl-D-erythritol kinase [Phycisphaerales bacterium]|nr:4-(cytidine 5'-diphospho)-2-C-methyl-D-erythritol kinase [Phycisphaerales bacterium]
MPTRFDQQERPIAERTARAKLNLALAVGPPRPGDGYHPICSWMARIDLADDLLVTRLEDDRLSRYAILWHPQALRKAPIDWSVTKDLAVRAHLLLEREAGRPLPVQMKLEKRIPVGGGLGGGSADAAAMLLAVRELFALDIPDDRLRALAATLGSDVAYLLADEPAVVEGVGETITPAPAVRGDVVLIFPDFGCPTGPVYKAFDAAPAGPLRSAEVRALAARADLAGGELFNDLADPACAVEPRLRPLIDRAAAVAGRPVHVTGSGSTLFAVCERGPVEARMLAEELADELAPACALPARLG